MDYHSSKITKIRNIFIRKFICTSCEVEKDQMKKQEKANQSLALCFYQQEQHYEAVKAFQLSEQQQKFVALPKEALQDCYIDKKRRPVVIIAEDTVVGFFVLHVGNNIRSFTDNPQAVLLRALSINQMYQGNGYGKQAMSMIPTFVLTHFEQVNEIVLAVNEKNNTAKRMYEKAGFQDLGRRRQGDKGRQHILHYRL